MKKTFYSACLILCCSTLTACGPVIQQPSPRPTPPPTLHAPQSTPSVSPSIHYPVSKGVETEPLISEDYVNQRIEEYGEKLKRWKELDAASVNKDLTQEQSTEIISCFRKLQKVIGGYNSLRTSFLRGEDILSARVSQIQQEDIAFIDSTCGPMLAHSEGADMSWANSSTEGLESIENLIIEYSKRGDFENVLQTWQQVPTTQQTRLSLNAQVQYAKALTYLRQEQGSISIYKSLLDSMAGSEQKLNPLALHKAIADLYTASGDYDQAQRHYNAINSIYGDSTALKDWSTLQLSILARSGSDAKELRSYSALLRDYLAFIPAKDGYKITEEADSFLKDFPYTPVASNVEKIKSDSLEQADTWYNGLEERVEEYKANDQYEEAINYLQAIPLALFPSDKAANITKKIEELLLADAIDRETQRMAQVQDLQKQWNNGMLLVNAERYDEALEVFRTLLGTDYETRAQIKIDEISLTAAKSERRKAADTYIRYTKTSDIESQKKLLISARKTLRDIIIKYPNVEIIGKVNKNIERVEQELLAIDPTILSTIQSQEALQQRTATPSEILDIFN